MVVDQETGLAAYVTAAHQLLQPSLPYTVDWVPPDLDTELKHLLIYFKDVAFQSLTVFGHSATEICNLVLRMAFSDSSPSAVALLQSATALAALHRNQAHEQATELKIRALKALARSAAKEITTKDVARHVVSGMLLCSYEIQSSTETSRYWIWYVCGAKSLVKSRQLDEPNRGDDFTMLLRWVQYYEVMARFSLRHWMRKLTMEFEFADKLGYHAVSPSVCAGDLIPAELDDPPSRLLDLLRAVVGMDLGPTLPHNSTAEDRQYRAQIENNLNSTTSSIESAKVESAEAVEAFRLSILVYLYRLTGELDNGQSMKVDGYVHKAFHILPSLDTLRFPFPLLVFGCEAQTDEQRRIILDLTDRTETALPTRAILRLKSIIRSAWVQEDLMSGARNGSIGYMGKMDGLISSQSMLPVFI